MNASPAVIEAQCLKGTWGQDDRGRGGASREGLT